MTVSFEGLLFNLFHFQKFFVFLGAEDLTHGSHLLGKRLPTELHPSLVFVIISLWHWFSLEFFLISSLLFFFLTQSPFLRFHYHQWIYDMALMFLHSDVQRHSNKQHAQKFVPIIPIVFWDRTPFSGSPTSWGRVQTTQVGLPFSFFPSPLTTTFPLSIQTLPALLPVSIHFPSLLWSCSGYHLLGPRWLCYPTIKCWDFAHASKTALNSFPREEGNSSGWERCEK